jgi:perosamine synthetase
MDDWKIPLYKIYTDDEDVNLITKIIKRGDQWAIGPEIEEFENAIKNYVGTEYCVSLNSGTSALHATLLAYGLGKNDEVIVPSFSFISTANSVLFVGATPLFSDIEETTFGLDPNKIHSSISPKTKAIIPMDYGGTSCQIFEIQKIAKENNLLLIEDAAESLGAKVLNKKVGSVADSSIFSFCGNKVITTGEGGAIVTNSKEIYEKTKLIRSHGRIGSKNYFADPSNPEYVNLGFNWRMSSITAALGIAQISKLDKIIKLRQENANFLSSNLSKFSQVKVPISSDSHEHIFQMYSILLENEQIRDKLHKFLLEKRIFSKIYFNPIHKTSFYQSKIHNKITLPITDKISSRILTLPLYANMTLEEKEYLISSLSEFFESLN